MATEVLSLDPYKINAYSEVSKVDEAVKFDLEPKNGTTKLSNGTGSHSVNLGLQDEDSKSFNPELSTTSQPSKEWELDVRGLISTRKWLQNYGLKKNRLDLHSILPQIGFKHSDEYDSRIKRPMCSRYGLGLFPKYNRTDGKSFNISCNRDKLQQIESRLSQAVALYKRRLAWLTTESRRIFGVIEEKAVTVVLDIKNMSPQQFDQYRAAVERVIKEQLAHVAKFNIIRAADDVNCYKSECVPVTGGSIDGAIDWLWDLDRLAPVGNTATCEAVVKALADHNVEAVYLFTEGSSSDASREILKEKMTGARLPLHVMSYNCSNSDTIHFLKRLAKITGGRFHAYAIVMEMDHYEGSPLDPTTNQANIILRKKTFGGVPPGAGMREDVILLFEELEMARSILAQVQNFLASLPEVRGQIGFSPSGPSSSEMFKEPSKPDRSENYMSSREWLDKYGLKPQKLGFYDILSNVAFRHRDGVLDLKEAPENEELQTDAITRQKLVNAKYCQTFPHVKWKDGQVVHVQVTPEIHRTYEQRMHRALEAIQQRIDWLQQGSRELFGTVIEDQIYILIDTSSSMDPHMQFVKDKLFILMQEQLRHKQKFNLISFDSKVLAWRERLVEVNEKNLQGGWQWVKNLTCKGSTNTLTALRLAMADTQTHAIYLLTDGRPDQPPKSILAQVQLNPQVPIHTISFNCSDREGNEFLCKLARDTGGRFHYYSDNGIDPDGPEPWESEDVRLLKQELETGYRNLEKIAMLRDECAALAWKKEEPVSRINKEGQYDRDSAMPPLEPKDLYRSEFERPHTALGHRRTPVPPHSPRVTSPTPRPSTAPGIRPGSAHGFRTPTSHARRNPAARPRSAGPTRTVSPRLDAGNVGHILRPSTKPLVAGHTRTSLLRTLNSNGQFQQKEWLLPETKDLFEKQWSRQQQLMKEETIKTKKMKKKTKKMTNPKTCSSKKWLSVHGLAAKKLTILDALAPTFIPHKPKYIPILNKHVLSKVFDDILPIAHASGHDRKKVRIVNPQGVDLEAYEAKVEAAVAKYKRRLNRIVWEALPDDEKQNFEKGPVSFLKHKKELYEALSRAGWPVSEQDLIRLEDEIKQGEVYLRQAQDLRKESKSAVKSESSDEESRAADSDDESPRSLRLTRQSSRSPSGQDASDHESEDNKDEDADQVVSDAENERDAEKDEDEKDAAETKPEDDLPPPEGGSAKDQNYEGLGHVRRKKVKKNKEVKDTPVTVTKVRKALDVLRGQRVIAKNAEDGLYYAGQVARCPDPRHALVLYDDLKSQHVPIRFVIPVGGAVARPMIRTGDYVLTRVINQDTLLECYIPGVVQMTPARAQDATKFFTVMVYTGQKIHTLRGYMVKISQERYTFLVRYIRDIAGDKENDQKEDRPHRSRSRSHSRSRSRSSSSRRSSKSRSRSSSRSNRGSQRRSRSRSYSRSRSRSNSPGSSVSSKKSGSRGRRGSHERKANGHENKRLSRWQHHLERQQRKQERQQKRLRKQAKKLELLQRKLESAKNREDPRIQEKRALLELLLSETTPRGLKVSTPKPDPEHDRTNAWVSEQNGHTEGEGTPRALLDLRKNLEPVGVGEEVLARWSDEGWYYRGTVKQDCGNSSYFVEDSLGDLEQIWRCDIITDNDDANHVLKPKDSVIALHPNYTFSYTPGVVLEVTPDLWIQVRFYDGIEARLPREEIYYIPQEKFEYDVQYIVQCEDQWIGQAVVARNDETGLFHIGEVKERIGDGRQYVIEWANKEVSIQSASYIFGAFTKRHPLEIGDRVLAMTEESELKYLPGWISGSRGKKMVVKFCDGSISNSVDQNHCFWLSQDYYNTVVDYYKAQNPAD